MPAVEHSVSVDVTVTAAYDQWTRFESYPMWMEGVASIEQVGDGRLHWVAKVRREFASFEGETREWDARVVEQTRDRRISWESIAEGPGEKPSAGAVTFEPIGRASCRVTFRIDWEPQEAVETTSEVLAAMDRVIVADLARFKDYVETRGEPSTEE